MEIKKTKDQNPEATVNPEENSNAANETVSDNDGKPEVVKEEKVVEEQGIVNMPSLPAGREQGIVEGEKIEERELKIEEEVPLTESPAPEEESKTEEPAASSQDTEVAIEKPEASSQEPEAVENISADDDTEEDADEDMDEDESDEEHEAFEEFSAEELISRLEELVQVEDITAIKTKVALIKVAYMKILKEEKQAELDAFLEAGGHKDDFKAEESKLEKRFNNAFDIYRKNKVKFNELQEKEKLENLEKKNEILEKLKELINSEETLKKTYDEFRALQSEWKEIGMVPSGEVSNLWQSYHFLVEKFFDKVKINKELRDLDMKKNLELKIELCEKTEELLLETSIIKSFKQLQKFHEEWKEIGPVPQEQNEEIWERFKAATDKINERRREHYGKLQEEQEQNLLAKSGLCEQAEELISTIPDNMKGWQEQTRKMTELFNVWKSIGRAPKKDNNAIWERFRSSMNTFYENKKEFLKTIKNEQMNNYNLKVDLCVEAENLKDSTDWKKTTQDLIRLQKEWKKIGPVPRKHSDKIWKRFRAACDEFFNKKSEHFSSIHENEQENLEKKKAIIEKVKAQNFTGDKAKNLDILKEFQREWMEIGFVPMKEKEKLQKEFRKVINARLDELKISETELSNASYATRMEAVKDSPDAGRVYRKEINFLNGKISKLSDDIILWENNLGFFANSKKADVLKKEFEEKIDKAKLEVASMKAKVKYLRKMAAE